MRREGRLRVCPNYSSLRSTQRLGISASPQSSPCPTTLLNGALTALRPARRTDRKSTRLNSSHSQISYAVFCLKKKKKQNALTRISAESVRSSVVSQLVLHEPVSTQDEINTRESVINSCYSTLAVVG